MHTLAGSFFNRHAVTVARIAPRPLRPFVSTRFQFYFTPLSGFFSPFPHGTGSLSVLEHIQPYRLVPADSLELFVSRATQERKHISHIYFAYGAITLWGSAS